VKEARTTDGRPGDRLAAGKRMIGGAATGGQTYAQRRLAGRALRARVPRSAHGTWEAPAGRADPVHLLEENNRSRLPDLVPVRYGRILSSPFAFLRGSAVIVAMDLAATPDTGPRVQACRDAHLGNFGVFGRPERTEGRCWGATRSLADNDLLRSLAIRSNVRSGLSGQGLKPYITDLLLTRPAETGGDGHD
jgi:Uncharacterized protein conserved in bacteria (DUF2252)